MPYFDTEVDVSVDDFLSACNTREIEKMIDYLIDDGYLVDRSVSKPQNMSFLEIEWENMINKLSQLRLRITNEDEETIKKIVNKY
jgi:hypothetical protein